MNPERASRERISAATLVISGSMTANGFRAIPSTTSLGFAAGLTGERTVIPRFADVTVKLIEDKQSGKSSGKTRLTLDVVSVQVNGRAIDVMTAEVSRASGSRTNKSGQVMGGSPQCPALRLAGWSK